MMQKKDKELLLKRMQEIEDQDEVYPVMFFHIACVLALSCLK